MGVTFNEEEVLIHLGQTRIGITIIIRCTMLQNERNFHSLPLVQHPYPLIDSGTNRAFRLQIIIDSYPSLIAADKLEPTGRPDIDGAKVCSAFQCRNSSCVTTPSHSTQLTKAVDHV